MFLVIARADDASAEVLVARLRRGGASARVLTPADLSASGWRHDPDDPAGGQAVVGGLAIAAREIRGVVTRLRAVTPDDVAAAIHRDDRAYAAAETQAFLAAWLSALPCPVLNRPTPWDLAGPGWGPEQWRACARTLGLDVRTPPRRRAVLADDVPPPDASPAAGPQTCAIDVVGDRCFVAGAEADGTAGVRLARAIAAATGLELLRVIATDEPRPAFIGAATGAAVEVASASVSDAIAHLLGADNAGAPARLRRIAVEVALA